MKTLAALALFATAACVGPTSGTARQASVPSPSADAGAVDAVKKVADDMGTAMVSGDLTLLDRIYAEDFVSIGMSGKTTTKQGLLSLYSSAHDKLLWFELGPTDVQVFGHVAVSQGSVKEKRVRDGKDTSGEFAWMDLLENRDGRWKVVRSAGARIAAPRSPISTDEELAVKGEIVQLQKRVGDAMVANDTDALSQFYADDWMTVRPDGSVYDKQGLLEDFRSQKQRLLSFELGAMKVQVLGDVAMAQASVSEKRIRDGKDISGEFVFMDLLERRGGTWRIVRTLGARVR